MFATVPAPSVPLPVEPKVIKTLSPPQDEIAAGDTVKGVGVALTTTDVVADAEHPLFVAVKVYVPEPPIAGEKVGLC